eukprot:90871-Rhodomonas_salina.2
MSLDALLCRVRRLSQLRLSQCMTVCVKFQNRKSASAATRDRESESGRWGTSDAVRRNWPS